MAAIYKLEVRITKFLMCMYGGQRCRTPTMHDANDDGQCMIVLINQMSQKFNMKNEMKKDQRAKMKTPKLKLKVA